MSFQFSRVQTRSLDTGSFWDTFSWVDKFDDISLSAGIRNKTLLFVCLTSTVALLALGYLLRRSSSVRSAGAWASAGHLHSQLVHDDVVNTTKLRLGTTWRQLSFQEYKLLIAELIRRKNVDVEQGELTKDGVLLDPWGRAYEIAIRKNETGAVEAVVRSVGSDGVARTADDVVYPKE